jgi:hypothetical protein
MRTAGMIARQKTNALMNLYDRGRDLIFWLPVRRDTLKHRPTDTAYIYKGMKGFKRIAVLLTTGFLAFAPPGTLIFLFMIILGVVGNVWLVTGGTVGVVLISVTWLMIRG